MCIRDRVTPEDGTVSAGGALLYLINRGPSAMAYASLGVGGLSVWSTCGEGSDPFCEDESHWGVGAGPGVGIELRIVKNLGWSVEIPLAFVWSDEGFHGIYPVPNTSLVYFW